LGSGVKTTYEGRKINMDKFMMLCSRCRAKVSFRVFSVSIPDMQITCENCTPAHRMAILEIESEDRAGPTKTGERPKPSSGRADTGLNLGIGADADID